MLGVMRWFERLMSPEETGQRQGSGQRQNSPVTATQEQPQKGKDDGCEPWPWLGNGFGARGQADPRRIGGKDPVRSHGRLAGN